MSTLSNDDVRRVRRCYKPGQTIKIQTVICNRGNARIITANAHIDGVYNRGMQVSFPINHRYGKKTWHRRWISWVDILTQPGKGYIYVTSGAQEEYVRPAKFAK